MRRPDSGDRVSLTAGIALLALGVVLLADRAGLLTLDFGSMAPIVFATVGAILLSAGLSRRG